MTVTFVQLMFYSGALFILFLTPGPVWVALIARSISGGFNSAWPLALGVVIGDAIWPLAAIFGVSYLISLYADFLTLLRYAGALMFLIMGGLLIARADKTIDSNSPLNAPGAWAGFTAGVLVILSNPKAILFYMGVLPGFFDFSQINRFDIAAICFISMLVPLLGNLILASFIGRVRRFMSSPKALRRMNITAGIALIFVGVVIALF